MFQKRNFFVLLLQAKGTISPSLFLQDHVRIFQKLRFIASAWSFYSYGYKSRYTHPDLATLDVIYASREAIECRERRLMASHKCQKPGRDESNTALQ